MFVALVLLTIALLALYVGFYEYPRHVVRRKGLK
jgi:uncharacterized membrane protein YobD (UPF0266 family)